MDKAFEAAPGGARESAAADRRAAWIYLAACALLLVSYALAFSGPFVYDDIRYVRENSRVHVSALRPAQLIMAASGSRPATSLSLGLSWYLHGPSPGWFRFENLLFHFLTGYLFLLLARRTLALLPRPPRDPGGLVPLAGALLWLFSPLAVQSVSYISQRSNLLCALFFVSSLLLFVRARSADERRGRLLGFAGCVLCGLLAMAAKQNAVMLPVMLGLYEWIFFRRGATHFFRRYFAGIIVALSLLASLAFVMMSVAPVTARPLYIWLALCPALFFLYKALAPWLSRSERAGRLAPGIFAGLAALLLVLLVAQATRPGDALFSRYEDLSFHPVTPVERVLTQSRVVFTYLTQLAFPWPGRLSLLHEVPLSRGLFSPWTTFFTGLFHLAALFSALVLVRRRPLFSFSVLWFYGNLAVESSIIPLDLMFEHRTYIPALFPMLLFSAALFKLLRSGRAFVPVAALLLAFCLASTSARNYVFGDDLRLWEDCIKKSPDSAAAYNNLGVSRLSRGEPARAERLFMKAAELDRFNIDASYNLGILYKGLGRVSEAEKAFYQALLIRRDYVFAENELGKLYLAQGRAAEAREHFEKAIAQAPLYAAARNNLGTLLMNQGDFAGALAQFEQAASLLPNQVGILVNMGVALTNQGRFERAEEVLRRATDLAPGSAAAHFALGNALLGTGDVAGSVKELFRALRLNPDDHAVRNSLAVAFSTQGMVDEAVEQYKQALGSLEEEVEIRRDIARSLAVAGLFPEARNAWGLARNVSFAKASVYKNLGLVLADRGDSARALENLAAAAALDPEDPEVASALGVLYASMNDYAKAAEQFSRAVRLSPQDPQARQNLGVTLARMGLYAKALEELSRAAELAPGDASIARDIRVVEKYRKKAAGEGEGEP